jgi:hypothetical protein
MVVHREEMQMNSSPSEARYSVSEAARMLRVHVATVWRWILHGVRGKKLLSVIIGGRRYVLDRDLQAFLCAGNTQRFHHEDLRRRADEAAKLLDALGVGGIAPRRRP